MKMTETYRKDLAFEQQMLRYSSETLPASSAAHCDRCFSIRFPSRLRLLKQLSDFLCLVGWDSAEQASATICSTLVVFSDHRVHQGIQMQWLAGIVSWPLQTYSAGETEQGSRYFHMLHL